MKKNVKTVKHQVYGTTKLRIGDPMYFKMMEAREQKKLLKKLTFDGKISSAPLGELIIELNHITDEEYGFEYDSIDVKVIQAFNKQLLEAYEQNKYYTSQLKGEYDLGCDTARFEVETKFGYDEFMTGGDGSYGRLFHMKQYYGMMLYLSFDADLFTFEEIEERFLGLFKERNAKTA